MPQSTVLPMRILPSPSVEPAECSNCLDFDNETKFSFWQNLSTNKTPTKQNTDKTTDIFQVTHRQEHV